MRRLDGVTHVRLDTAEQYAVIWIGEPTELDFEEFEQAAEDALYTTSAMWVQVSGTVVAKGCEHCGRERNFIQVRGSDQTFELGKNTLKPGATLQLDAQVLGWDTGHPLLLPVDK